MERKTNIMLGGKFYMSIILYSTGCPKCNVLEAKLNSKSIKYEVCRDIEVMQSKGMMSAPNLEVDGELMDFSAAIKWVREYKEMPDNNEEQYQTTGTEEVVNMLKRENRL
jgi:glutaredoxin